MADPTYQPKTYRDQGGDRFNVVGGGTLNLEGRITGLMPTTDYFVDAATGSDSDDGLSWANAKITIGAAMTLAAALGTRGRARIFVAPGGYSEDLVTPLNTEAPFGQLIAVNPTSQSFGAVYLSSATATEPVLTVKARGWLFDGFEFDGPATDGCVLLDGASSNSNAAGTEIRNCIFVGQNQADFGLDVTKNGAPYTKILNCHFQGIVGPAMKCSSSATDQPSYWLIDECTFVDNSSHINMNPRGFKWSQIRNCTFLEAGGARTATVQIDNTGGTACAIGPGNFLSDTYDTAGGYVAGSDEDWYGNACEDGFSSVNPTA